jgi:hypothetical protein
LTLPPGGQYEKRHEDRGVQRAISQRLHAPAKKTARPIQARNWNCCSSMPDGCKRRTCWGMIVQNTPQAERLYRIAAAHGRVRQQALAMPLA